MTSFAYPPTMAGHNFDPYSTQDTYADFPTTSQSYSASAAYLDSPFTTALPSIDSYPAMSAFAAEMPRAQDSYGHYLDSGIKNAHHTYSPVANETEQMLPPRLSASSESGASAQSTSSS